VVRFNKDAGDSLCLGRLGDRRAQSGAPPGHDEGRAFVSEKKRSGFSNS
jgi:hypothetical protein